MKFPADIAEVLECSFRMESASWTSHDVAKRLGRSQSFVSRVWQTTFPAELVIPQLPVAFAITEVSLNADWLVIKGIDHSQSGQNLSDLAKSMRSSRREPLQLLVTAFALVGATTQADLFAFRSISNKEFVLEISSPEIALRILRQLVSSSSATSPQVLIDLQNRLSQWQLDQDIDFTWKARELVEARPAARNSSIASTNQIIADQVLELIIEEIRLGNLKSGSRLVESSFARRLHTTRNQTRDALRNLAASGLLDFHPSRGIVLPSPRRADILEIYLARRALGIEIIRRCADLASTDLVHSAKAIDDLVETAKSSDAYLTGEKDLAYQQALADDSGLRNIPTMFRLLANQLRIYIALLGFRYTYSITDMVADDTEIHHLIVLQNPSAAITKWQQKMSAAHEYLATQLR